MGGAVSAEEHRHHAVQVVIGLSGRFRVTLDEERHEADFFIIGANRPHLFDGAGGRQAILLMDPEMDAAKAVTRKLSSEKPPHWPDSRRFADAVRRLDALTTGDPFCEEARMVCTDLLEIIAGPVTPSETCDERIQKARDILSNLSEKRITVGELARTVGLSESRLMHLFTREVGIPLRRYILWLKMLEALKIMMSRESFTTAAHGADFSDSAHLSRTFRDMFGMTPSQMFQDSRFVQALICPDR